MKFPPLFIALTVLAGIPPTGAKAGEAWQTKLLEELPLLGRGNWIVVVDAAYPWQVAPGMEMVETNADAPDVINTVLKAISAFPHVQPIFYSDAELPFVSETDAPGISAYRATLQNMLTGKPAQSLPQTQILAQMEEAGQAYHVLVLKTRLTLPYTALFMQLQSGYWNDVAEQRLRAAMSKAAPAQ